MVVCTGLTVICVFTLVLISYCFSGCYKGSSIRYHILVVFCVCLTVKTSTSLAVYSSSKRTRSPHIEYIQSCQPEPHLDQKRSRWPPAHIIGFDWIEWKKRGSEKFSDNIVRIARRAKDSITRLRSAFVSMTTYLGPPNLCINSSRNLANRFHK